MTAPKHEPTPERIRRECEQIQAGWSEGEEQRRRAWSLRPAKFPKGKESDVTETEGEK